VWLPLVDSWAIVEPVAAWGGQVILRRSPFDTNQEQSFFAWDPDTGWRTPLWGGEPGKQDIVADTSGDWAAVVRTGMSLPFAQWSLVLRNMRTSESRVIALAHPALPELPGLDGAPPLGYMPAVSLSGNDLVWNQYVLRDGKAAREIRHYNIATADTALISAVEVATGRDLRSPAVADGTVAWIEWGTGGGTSIRLYQLATGELREVANTGNPFQLTLLDGARTLIWDDAQSAKYALDLWTGQRLAFAEGDGWGVIGDGLRAGWAPATAYGGAGGYFDSATGEVRTLGHDPDIVTNIARPLGPWFAWQELRVGEQMLQRSGFWFLRIG
jgi:hypothetical protein